MAEVITSASSDGSGRKQGKLFSAEDLIITGEVAAIGAHVARYGEVRQTIKKVPVSFNRNPHMSQKVSCKSVQDRNKGLQDAFYQEDAQNSALSGFTGS